MAEVAVREMLREIAAKTLASRGHCKLSASDLMDDGSCIQLTINIDPSQVPGIHLISFIFILVACYNIVLLLSLLIASSI